MSVSSSEWVSIIENKELKKKTTNLDVAKIKNKQKCISIQGHTIYKGQNYSQKEEALMVKCQVSVRG